MAYLRDKLPDNTPGEFYVDRECIDCDVCRDTSPANFRRNDDNGYSYVHKQPETPDEVALCEEAVDACPVEAIGDDGRQIAHDRMAASLSVPASANAQRTTS